MVHYHRLREVPFQLNPIFSDNALNTRELDVLVRMEYQRDKAIAAALGLTYDGVRYRVRSIFAKLGTSRRHDAVRRARALGILPPAEGSGMGS